METGERIVKVAKSSRKLKIILLKDLEKMVKHANACPQNIC